LSDGNSGSILINRMNRTQCSIYHLGAEAPALPDHPGYTDVTEATLFLAIFGPDALFIAEKLSNLDLGDPKKTPPFLLQGPFCHVPCQIVTLAKDADGGGGFILTCSRGYGKSMVHAILDAGAEFGLRPAGEKRFQSWLAGLEG
jgi:glycine cleavage system aminomethyltransferase T